MVYRLYAKLLTARLAVSEVKPVLTDKQTDRHSDNHTDRQTDRQTDKQTVVNYSKSRCACARGLITVMKIPRAIDISLIRE